MTDLSQFTRPLEDATHLWRTSSMGRWHVAVPHRNGQGIDSPCGAGGVSDLSTFRWRGGRTMRLDAVSDRAGICARCRRMLDAVA